jgi:hypothetical protein
MLQAPGEQLTMCMDCEESHILFWGQQVRRKERILPMFQKINRLQIISQVELPFSAEVTYDAYSNLTRPITKSVGIQAK